MTLAPAPAGTSPARSATRAACPAARGSRRPARRQSPSEITAPTRSGLRVSGALPGHWRLAQPSSPPTDTFARGWMQAFSDMARRYGIYIVGSNTRRRSASRATRPRSRTFARPRPANPKPSSSPPDPRSTTRPSSGGRTRSPGGPAAAAQRGRENQKVPLTPFEESLQVSNGPSSGPDGRANSEAVPAPAYEGEGRLRDQPSGLPVRLRLRRQAAAVDPCSDIAATTCACLALGTNVVIQDEANDAQWAGLGGGGMAALGMDGLELARSHRQGRRHRLQRDAVHGRQPRRPVFDGQSPITQRRKAMGRGCTYVGNRHFMAGPTENDPAEFKPYAGRKRQFLGSPGGSSPAPTTATSSERPRLTWPRAPAARSRTTTSRPRSSPTCRSRWTSTGPPAPAALGWT